MPVVCKNALMVGFPCLASLIIPARCQLKNMRNKVVKQRGCPSYLIIFKQFKLSDYNKISMAELL